MEWIRVTALAAAIVAISAPVRADELGRQDLTAPGAMISVCGGLNWSGSAYAVGDKGWWLPGQVSCNAAQSFSGSVSQSVNHVVASPQPIQADASGSATLGQLKLYAHARATPAAGFVQAEATGGWEDVITLMPVNPADIGKTAVLSFAIQADGTLAGQAPGEFSFNSGAGLGIKPYIDGASLTGPVAEVHFNGQGQFNFPYNQTVSQSVGFSTTVTLGTPFELGVYARAIAGNSSAGDVYTFNEATVDFLNTLSWAGITGLTVDGNAVAYTLSSASGIDWTQDFTSAVPEPATWALWAAGLLGMVSRRRRWHGPAAVALAACAMTPASALTITASASAASLQPATVAPGLDLQNGDFLIHANLQAQAPHVTGDGLDETTTWVFDFGSQPGYAAFLASGPLVSAQLTLRLNTAFFPGGVGPVTDIAVPSDGVVTVGPGWLIPSFMTGTMGTYQLGSVSTDLITAVGTDPTALRDWMVDNAGRMQMLYADDAIVTGAVLQLTTAPVPEPSTWALLASGALLLAVRRRLGR